ncbi:hypothetical protein Nepgr_015471 [Nepenthes gracilis]|uniref:Fibronectin type-III domain-containing protein n=1 Tax=Nepenthes gracilis TaxID=150966 RepID=A0AAD3SMX8_NEPGR|nr:hypothetical protein Nepgr_015471 [Nepenthes gracilis]
MDSSFDGVVLDPAKCSKLSIDEKRELIYEISNWSHDASKMLQSWSRQEILQILCAEMGIERKYTGLTKLKIIEHLLNIVSRKNSGRRDNHQVLEQQSSPMAAQRTPKRSRKPDHTSWLPVSASGLSMSYGDSDLATGIYCKNSACKARLSRGDVFCKRCSCCICHKFDDNKDPSLWLTCSSEPPFQGHSCNMSCHLECFLSHEESGTANSRHGAEIDGIFYCVSCGKANGFLSCWRKQLMIAKETRRVDILCYRLSLCQKLLSGRKLYQKLSEMVDEAVKKLGEEVGPFTGLPVKIGRGIVNRLSSGQEVQRLCGSAVEALDSMAYDMKLHQLPDDVIQDCKMSSRNMIRFEDICARSVTVVLGPDSRPLGNNVSYTFWHYKAYDGVESTEPTCTLFPPESRIWVSGLDPATEYVFKVVSSGSAKESRTCEARITTSSSEDEAADANCPKAERGQSPATNCSTLSNPSVGDETCNVTPCSGLNKNRADSHFGYCNNAGNVVSSNLSAGPTGQDEDRTFASDVDHAVRKVCTADQSDAVKLEDKRASEGRSGEATGMDNGSMIPSRPLTFVVPEALERPGKNVQSNPNAGDLENGYGKGDRPQERILAEQRSGEDRNEEHAGHKNDTSNEDFERYVKVIRWLECDGLIEKSFRQKFLTWYSIRATPQERRVVKVFVDTFSSDLNSLAEQLIDTFEEIVSSKRASVVRSGFCTKLGN